MSPKKHCKDRERVHRQIVDLLTRHQLLECIRGSWKFGDFHLGANGRSLSDLDLVVAGLESRVLMDLRNALADQLPVRMNVSIHPADFLLQMTLRDSRILNICEYVAKMRTCGKGTRLAHYSRAKILLLLLREDAAERYKDVAGRLGSYQAQQALRVKLGEDSRFSIALARSMAVSSGQPEAMELVEECISRTITPDYFSDLTQRLVACPTIDHWLKRHLLTKMGMVSGGMLSWH